ncbi:MAG: glycosyltransferase family 2 protein [Ignavibacteriales bacterium]|nr:MAG: glycosyltransferase family 2 protein [Ignavibacteriales bacterium]
MLISIIIINYNLAKEIEDCLKSLYNTFSQVDELEFEIIIIDNNSPDKKLPVVQKKFNKSNISFYYQDENLGFGKACNFGASKAKGNIFCFLNPDTIISENIFSLFTRLLIEDNSVGIVGPKQLTRKPFFDFSAGFYPNPFFEFFHVLGIGVFLEGLITHFYSKLSKKNFLKVGWILGAAIFIRREVFTKVSGFDKDYFMFSEEVDLCKRVSNAGFKIIYAPKHRIHHIGSVSGKKNYMLYTIRTYSSKNIFISKHSRGISKLIMKLFLRIELIVQIIIWTFLIPFGFNKSVQKIKAFLFLIQNNLKYNPAINVTTLKAGV